MVRKNIEWKDIKNLEGRYQVSNYGDFKRLDHVHVQSNGKHVHYKEKVFWSECLSDYGGDTNQSYLGIHLGSTKKTYVHRIAAEHFIPNTYGKPEVNHKDGNTKNNYCGCKEKNYTDSNLEWVTRQENIQHAVDNNLFNHESILRKTTCQKNQLLSVEANKKPVIKISKDGRIICQYSSIKEASDSTGILAQNIGEICRGKGYRKSAGGFMWSFVDDYNEGKIKAYVIDQGSGSRKSVAQYTMSGDLVLRYRSVKEACEMNGWSRGDYIGECCNGKRKKYKNHIWKWE